MFPTDQHGNSNEDGAPQNEGKMSSRRNGNPEFLGLPEKMRIKKTEAGISKQTTSSSDRDECKMTPEAFQELLEERSSEMKLMAEGKRSGVLQHIASAEKVSGIGVNPLALLPEDIWIEILKKLNPKDRACMYDVHTVFRDLMDATRIQDTLFPLVLKYEVPLVEAFLAPFTGYPKRNDLTQLMILRQVSKNLRESVDRWIKERLIHLMQSPESVKASNLNSVHFKLTDSLEKLEGIGKAFSREPKPKRLFLRSLKIEFSRCIPRRWGRSMNEEERLEIEKTIPIRYAMMKENITELLEHVGDQILHFDLEFHGTRLSLQEIYDIVREWLMLMPNLKWLGLETSGSRLDNLSWTGNENQVIVMPSLPTLERIDIAGFQKRNIWNSILMANPHIKYHTRGLKINFSEFDAYTDPAVLSLSLENVYLGGLMRGHWDLPKLQQICVDNCNWNLKKLIISMSLGKNGSSNIDGVFRCLQKFQTLEDIELHIDHVTVGDEINFLRLPNLKTFFVEFGPTVKSSGERDFFFSLQFLIHCGKLEKLTWHNHMYNSQSVRRRLEQLGPSDGIMIDFRGGNTDLSGSNVWDVFPLLKIIKVRFREGAEEKGRKYFERVYHDRKLVKDDKKKWRSLLYQHHRATDGKRPN